MARRRSRDVLDFANEAEAHILDTPVRLRDIRRIMARIEAFAEGVILKRSTLGMIAEIADSYYTLPEMIAFFRRQQETYREYIRNGDLDDRHDRHVLISGVYGACWRWMERRDRYPYGDVRLLRPLIGDVLTAAETWDEKLDEEPYPERLAELARWHEELAPGGALYPSDEHLAYVKRFEAFAEEIVWDSRDHEYITIVNFPAPSNVPPPHRWWCTQHVLTG
jgi:hypothetical protein